MFHVRASLPDIEFYSATGTTAKCQFGTRNYFAPQEKSQKELSLFMFNNFYHHYYNMWLAGKVYIRGSESACTVAKQATTRVTVGTRSSPPGWLRFALVAAWRLELLSSSTKLPSRPPVVMLYTILWVVVYTLSILGCLYSKICYFHSRISLFFSLWRRDIWVCNN